jgi:hypothetical protein
MLAMLALPATLVVSSVWPAPAAAANAEQMVTPEWTHAITTQGAACVDASVDHDPFTENNTRWSFYALPEGKAPAGGWPVYIDFLAQPYTDMSPDIFPGGKVPGKCGNGWLDPAGGWGPPPPPQCIDYLENACPRPKFQAMGASGADACLTCYNASAWSAHNCSSSESREWCEFVPGQEEGGPTYKPFDTPAASLAGCFNKDGSWNTTGCSFNQWAGELWNARTHQFLLANGIAVVQLNPYTSDTWEWYTPDLPLGSGLDQPYFKKLFSTWGDGTYAKGVPAGALNPAKIIVSGYSSGAQMSSWMMELQARKALPVGSKVVAGVFFSGGSHMCYQNPPEAVSQCKTCSTGSPGFRRLQHHGPPRGGCSATMPQPVECEYCCPENVTEMYYMEHPEDYKTHPPVFLAQSEKSDMNADLCAAKNYYDTAVAHGVTSKLVLLKGEWAASYCMGNSSNPAAQGSPYIDKMATVPPGGGFMGGSCIDHTMGFADAVLPLTEFVLAALAAAEEA